jgi:penicillin amidase
LWWKRLADAAFAALAPGDHAGLRDMLRNERVVEYLQQSPEREEIMLPALAAAAKDLTALQGEDRSKWNWGALHVVHLQHGLPQFELPSYPRPGDGDTVNSTGYSRTSFEQNSGASFRQLLDLSDWDQSLAINSPGQSGRPGDKHFIDLLPLWLEGKYFPLAYSRDSVTSIAERTTLLEP